MAQATNTQYDEIVEELGRRTRPHVVVVDHVETFGFFEDGRMAATAEWLEGKTDAELGKVVFDQISRNVRDRVVTTQG